MDLIYIGKAPNNYDIWNYKGYEIHTCGWTKENLVIFFSTNRWVIIFPNKTCCTADYQPKINDLMMGCVVVEMCEFDKVAILDERKWNK